MGGVRAIDPVQDLQQQIDDLSHLKQLSEAATAPLEGQVADIQKKIANIGSQLKAAQAQTVQLQKELNDRQAKLEESYQYLSVRVRSFYILSRNSNPLMTLLSVNNAQDLTRELNYRSAAAERDKNEIVQTTSDILKLEDDKKALEQRKVQLAALNDQFQKNVAFLAGRLRKLRTIKPNYLTKLLPYLPSKKKF